MSGERSRSLESFLQDHPWPDALRGDREPVESLWRFELAATPAQLWPYLIETSRLNRSLRLARMEFDETPEGILRGRARNAGFEQVWEEVPWDWVEARQLTAIRCYSRGFATVARVIYELEAVGGDRCALFVYFGFTPRAAFGRAMLRIASRWLEKGYRRALGHIEAHIGEDVRQIEGFSVAAPPLDPDRRARLYALRDELRRTPASAEAVDRLAGYVEGGDETDLYRIQIRPLARRWGLDEDALLLACLYATRVGLLDLSWDVICPHCRGVTGGARSLGEVPSRGACAACEVDFATDNDQALEITFHVHPSIRDVPRVYYCSAEPATKLHIHVQQRLAPGETRAVDTALPPGRYRLRVRGHDRYRYLDVGRGGGERAVAWSAESGPERIEAAAAPRLALENPLPEPRIFVLEDVRWSDDALRPSRLFNLQEFRDLFSEEYLATDIQIAVGEQTVLFTDMVGSTRFYNTRGDPQAFMEVKRHFTELYDEVRARRGAVVKTIGDAAMAAFADPLDALMAAAAIMRRFHPGRGDTVIRLRASLNTGPCIAVNLNSGIDYFGNTVNVASKLQACAGAGQIAFSRAVLDGPGVRDALAELGVAPAPSSFEHEAIERPIEVYVWDVHAQPRPARAGESSPDPR